jgi:hypothetical protein
MIPDIACVGSERSVVPFTKREPGTSCGPRIAQAVSYGKRISRDRWNRCSMMSCNRVSARHTIRRTKPTIGLRQGSIMPNKVVDQSTNLGGGVTCSHARRQMNRRRPLCLYGRQSIPQASCHDST